MPWAARRQRWRPPSGDRPPCPRPIRGEAGRRPHLAVEGDGSAYLSRGSLYHGDLDPALLAAELADSTFARMPFIEAEGWSEP